MSTRCTIAMAGPIHIYKEITSDQICFEYMGVVYADTGIEIPERNEKYDTPVMKIEWLAQLHRELGEWLLDIESRKNGSTKE